MKKILSITSFCLIILSQNTFAQDTTAAKQPVVQGYDKAPQYPGGEQKMIPFIISNFKFPQTAIRDNVGGIVVTSFLVNTDGKLSNIKIQKGVRKDLNDEALRLVRLMGKWEPGSLKGQPVPVTYTLPFNFGTPPKQQGQAPAPATTSTKSTKLPAKGWNFPVAQPAKKK